MRAGRFGILVAMLVILAGAGSFAYYDFTHDGEPLPPHGAGALIAGVIYTIVITCGLIALLYLSSRQELVRIRREIEASFGDRFPIQA
jgi:hypothetical protein